MKKTNGFERILILAVILWLAVILGYEFLKDKEEFFSGILYNLIFGIPLSIVTSLFSSWMFSHYFLRKRELEAENFYERYVGVYKELKVISLKKPTTEWERIEITREKLNLNIHFVERVYDNRFLRARLELSGNFDLNRNFELFYLQDSSTGEDEGYWGKYDIQFLENGEVIGHKYHTSDKPGPDGRVHYIITRIKWIRIDSND